MYIHVHNVHIHIHIYIDMGMNMYVHIHIRIYSQILNVSLDQLGPMGWPVALDVPKVGPMVQLSSELRGSYRSHGV